MSLLYNLIFIDVTQLVAEPLRTGVQRVLTQIATHLPRARVMPFRVIGRDRVGILDAVLFDLMTEYFERDSPTFRSRAAELQAGMKLPESAEEARVRLVGNRPVEVLSARKFFQRAQVILNLENFADPERAAFYLACPEAERSKVYHLIHDFLLFEEPGLFPQLDWRHAWNYVRLFEAWSRAGGFFVSNPELGRRVARYFNRPESDVHLIHFGGDIRGPARAPLPGGRRRIVMLGTIEPRKYPEEAIAALDLVAEEADGAVECIVVGGWGWVSPEARARIEMTLGRGRVRHLQGLPDSAVAELMAGTDVALYISVAEGFGLPVIEFAARGIPVVTNDGVPAAAMLPDALRVPVDIIDAQSVAAAIRTALDRGVSEQVRYERTWAGCAAEILAVLDAGPVPRAPDGRTQVVNGWEITARLAKTFEDGPRDWEELKVAVRARLEDFIAEASLQVIDPDGRLVQRLPPVLLEEVSAVISDNRGLRYWSEIEGARPHLALMIRCILADNYIECLRQAYIGFLGRPIDPRAAAEAPVHAPLSRALHRVREIAFSDECARYLGQERARALRKVVGDVGGLLEAFTAEQPNLFHIMAALEMGEPALGEVFEAAALLTEGVSPLELALYVARLRQPRSDMTSYLLDVLAEVLLGRSMQIKVRYDREELNEAPDQRSFLRRAYRLLLRKEIDDGGLTYYQGELRSGRLSRNEVIDRLLAAQEARSRGITAI